MSDSDSDPSDLDRPTEAIADQTGSAARETAAEMQTIAADFASEAQASYPKLSGFEFVEELGRGGMGVVFKARDTKLDRMVAVKMILGGKLASPEEIQRFRFEGEAAARLDHPGIVPIYEIGEAKGNHFFSMKFIDGAPLSKKLDEYQSEPNKNCRVDDQNRSRRPTCSPTRSLTPRPEASERLDRYKRPTGGHGFGTCQAY